uniref:Spectrin repeat-containing, nuclear envelope 2, gene 2 n=1 Tax=Xenopus tropicalis TaxID=8364 RepID=A0A803K718_XENTR
NIFSHLVKKLKETLVIIQQLDKNMSNLRTWLAQIESELSKPVIYSICNDQEIQKKLSEQQWMGTSPVLAVIFCWKFIN